MAVRVVVSFCLGLLVVFSVAQRADAQQYTSLYVFGDSLSDTGNAFALTGGASPPSPPYFNGRTSNGPLWVESLAPALGFTYTQATNFAVAGAESGAASPTGGLNQVNGFLGAGGSVPAGALTVVWIGNNDFLNNAATTPPSELTASVVTNVGTMIGTLNAFGAQDFLIPNLPKFGLSPGGAATGLADSLNALASFYNTNLHTTLIGLEDQLGVNIFIMDIEGLFDDVVADPSAYGLANVTIPCLTPAGPTGACPTAESLNATLFYDPIHPTAAGHSIISQFATATLAQFQQPRVVAAAGYMGPIIADAQRQSVEQRLMTLRSMDRRDTGPLNVWASYRMGSGDRDDRPAAAGFDYDVNQVTVGFDKVAGDGWAAGLAATIGTGEYELLDGIENDIDTLAAALYVTYGGQGGLYIDISAGYSDNDFKGTRNTSFAPRPTAGFDVSGNAMFAAADLGWGLNMDGSGITLTPYAGLRYVSSDVGAYGEVGAAMLNLTVLDQRAGGLIGQVGLEVGGAVSNGGFTVAPIIRVAYETELDSLDYGAAIQTSTGQLASIGRGSLSDNRITANAGIALVGERLSLEVSYQGSIDYSDGKDTGVIGRVSYAF